MKKIILCALVILSLSFASCVFEGTGTVRIYNETSHSITAVNFIAVSGGDSENHSASIEPDSSQAYYSIEPGIYDIQLTVDTIGTFIAWNDDEVKEGTLHIRTLNESDLP